MKTATRTKQRGFTLTEALVAFGITATGLLAVASFQGDLISDSAFNKARTEALALAESYAGLWSLSVYLRPDAMAWADAVRRACTDLFGPSYSA